MVRGGRREEGSGWGIRVYLWRIHVDIWQNQYNIVKLKNKKNVNITKSNLQIPFDPCQDPDGIVYRCRKNTPKAYMHHQNLK